MDTVERSRSRTQAYLVLADLYLNGVTEDTFEDLRGMPVLGEPLPAAFDADHWASEYQRLFGFNVPPYASVFMEPDGHLGGEVSDAVERMYRGTGFVVNDTGTMPDHLGDMLAFLAYLNERCVRAVEHGDAAQVSRFEPLTAEFLARYLFPWLPVFAETMRHQQHALFAEAARLTLELVADHAGALPGHPQAIEPHLELRDPPQTPRDLARFLVRPCHAGVYVSRGQIAALGRRVDLPAGFIEREQMLVNLLEAADRFDARVALRSAFLDHLEGCRTFYAEQPLPGALKEHLEARVDRTRVLLDHYLTSTSQSHYSGD